MRHLYRSKKNRTIAGVCGGIAEYFDIDPVVVRLIFILFFFIGGAAIIAYIIGAIIIPNPPEEHLGSTNTNDLSPKSSVKTVTKESSPTPTPTPVSSSNTSLITGIILVLVGAYFLMGNLPFLRQFYWWFRWNLWDFFIPGVFIVIGIIVLIQGSRKNQKSS